MNLFHKRFNRINSKEHYNSFTVDICAMHGVSIDLVHVTS